MVKDSPGHDKKYSIDSRLLQRELGWKPRYDFKEGISQTIHWYLKNKEWMEAMIQKSGYLGERLGIKHDI